MTKLQDYVGDEEEQVIATYNYTDLASGTGYVDYYLIESETNAGKDYHLTPLQDYSNSVSIDNLSSTTDLDYDLTPFILPQTVEGTALISLPVYSTVSNNPTYTLELYQVVGGVETQIGSTLTFQIALTTSKMLYMPLEITRTDFKTDDVLRLRVKVENPGATLSRYGIDPANRTSATLNITTTSKISIPFKVDL